MVDLSWPWNTRTITDWFLCRYLCQDSSAMSWKQRHLPTMKSITPIIIQALKNGTAGGSLTLSSFPSVFTVMLISGFCFTRFRSSWSPLRRNTSSSWESCCARTRIVGAQWSTWVCVDACKWWKYLNCSHSTINATLLSTYRVTNWPWRVLGRHSYTFRSIVPPAGHHMTRQLRPPSREDYSYSDVSCRAWS